MSLNETPSGERIHIGFFGSVNAGKSSLVNKITNQELSVVSEIKGTTTDLVQKNMELLPLGAVTIIDCPGFGDDSEIGEKRIKKAKKALSCTDIAVLAVDSTIGMNDSDKKLTEIFKNKNIPYVIAYTKSDLLEKVPESAENGIFVSSKTGENIEKLKEMIGLLKPRKEDRKILEGLVNKGDTVVLVIPIDESVPKGRIILPQQQTLREILDIGAAAICCRDTELEETLLKLKNPPSLVITDSQAFGRVSKLVPESVPLTSFSILFARYKGELNTLLAGANALDTLNDADKVLISEGCTHHRQCGDIGTVKLPAWIKKYTGKNIEISFTSGTEFPDDLKDYKLIIHCGGCMLNQKEMYSRMARANDDNVPMTNYGMVISKVNGILNRAVKPLCVSSQRQAADEVL